MLAALLLAASAALAAEDASHAAPAQKTQAAASAFAERQNTLAEMWQRGLIAADSQNFSANDEDLLARMRLAEKAGAVGFLRSLGPTGGLIVDLKMRDGRHHRLTKAGFERWRMLRTQGALQFFQSKDIGAKEAFLLKDLDGDLIFEKDGFLSEKGQTLYNLIIAGMEAHWVTPSGEILGNRRAPPKAAVPRR